MLSMQEKHVIHEQLKQWTVSANLRSMMIETEMFDGARLQVLMTESDGKLTKHDDRDRDV